METISLPRSRYGDDRFLKKVRDNVWSTEGFKKIQYIRFGEREDGEGFSYIDFDGGPMLSVGSRILKDKFIDKILFEDGRYLIYLKDL